MVAHEIAHVEMSHVRNRYCEAVAALGDEGIAFAQVHRATQEAVVSTGNTRLAVQLMVSNHDRELAADRRAAELLREIGMNPQAVERMLVKLSDNDGAYTWSHPALETRLESLGGMPKGHNAPF